MFFVLFGGFRGLCLTLGLFVSIVFGLFQIFTEFFFFLKEKRMYTHSLY